MLFSIIVPVFNTQKYLQKCLESIRKQKYNNFEVILIDDGSSDNSPEICDSYTKKDSRFSVIHKANEGQGVARNIGLTRAKGEFIIFVDSDDYIDENLLGYLSGIIKLYNPELIIYKIRFLSELKAKLSEGANNSNVNEVLLGRYELWDKYLDMRTQIGGWVSNKCIRKELFKDNNLNFAVVRAREDAYLWAELFQKVNRIIDSDYIGYTQVVRYGSTEQRVFSPDFLLSLEISKVKFEFVKQEYPDLMVKAYMRVVETKIASLEMMLRDRKEKKYANEFLEIKRSLNKDIYMIEKNEYCKPVYEKIEYINRHPIKWWVKWRVIGIKTSVIRFKRYIYAKII